VSLGLKRKVALMNSESKAAAAPHQQPLVRKWADLALWAVAILALGAFLWASISLMSGPDFNDETEKLLASQLMLQGQLLYKDIFVQHGPFVYMLSHLFDLVTGNKELYWPRVIPIAMSLLSIAAIAASPAISGLRERLWAVTLTSAAYGMLLALYSLVMAMYQVYSGYLFTIALSLALIPALLGIRLKRWHLIVAGAALAAMGLNAISFGIAITLCCAALAGAYAPDWREVGRVVGWTIIGALSVIAVVAIWMLLFADFVGFFVDHIYINLTAYRSYLGQFLYAPFRLLLPWQPWLMTVPPSGTNLERVIYSLVFFVMVAFFFTTLTAAKRKWWHTTALVGLLFIGVVYTNPRFAASFGASTYVIVVSALVVLIAIILYRTLPTRWPALALVGALLVAGMTAQAFVPTSLYGLPVSTYYSTKGPLYERKDAEFELVRTIVGEDEGILQVPFDLYRYVWAGRNPASGVFFWMPWMHDYGQQPILGYDLDVCDEIERTQPKIIYFADFAVWGHPTDRWMGCVKELVASRYVRVGALGEKAMLRADVLADRPELLSTAAVTNELDLSLLTPSQARVLNDAMIEFGELRQDGLCLAETGTPGGDGQIVSQPCNVDPKVRIVSRGPASSAVIDEKTGLCLEKRAVGVFAKCRGLAPEQGFAVLTPSDSLIEIRVASNQAQCVSTPADGLAIMPCSPDTSWRNPERQEFAVRSGNDDTSEIVSKSTGWCLEVTGASQEAGSGLRVWPCTGSPSQAFHVNTEADGKIEVRNVFSDRCVTVRDVAVSQQTCDETTRLSLVIED
jgi:hypothetical protein